MKCVLFRRSYPAPLKISGTGAASYASLAYNGQTYYSAATIYVKPGDTVTFTFSGNSTTQGYVRINGTNVATTNSTATYEWTVPHGVKQITAAITYNSGGATNRYSRFTVTTT